MFPALLLIGPLPSESHHLLPHQYLVIIIVCSAQSFAAISPVCLAVSLLLFPGFRFVFTRIRDDLLFTIREDRRREDDKGSQKRSLNSGKKAKKRERRRRRKRRSRQRINRRASSGNSFAVIVVLPFSCSCPLCRASCAVNPCLRRFILQSFLTRKF